jgi:hypothetical protein
MFEDSFIFKNGNGKVQKQYFSYKSKAKICSTV